jgi:hypothetical protein
MMLSNKAITLGRHALRSDQSYFLFRTSAGFWICCHQTASMTVLKLAVNNGMHARQTHRAHDTHSVALLS